MNRRLAALALTCLAASACAGELVESGDITSGENWALRFHGAGVDDIDRVKIPIDDPATSEPGPPVDVGATDFTIELWIRAPAAENRADAIFCGPHYTWIAGNIVIDRDRLVQPRTYGISIAGGVITFGVQNAAQASYTVCGGTRIDDGAWHHVAVTRAIASGELAIWVDGALDGSATGPTGDISYPNDGVPRCGVACGSPDPYVVIGAEKHDVDARDYPSFSGWLDELRYSTVRRYTAGFTPPSRRFDPDAATAALYHFDEGVGDQIRDSSGAAGGPSNGVRRLGGSPAGPEWVTSDAPTGR